MSDIETTATHETPAPITNGVVEGQTLSKLTRKTKAHQEARTEDVSPASNDPVERIRSARIDAKAELDRIEHRAEELRTELGLPTQKPMLAIPPFHDEFGRPAGRFSKSRIRAGVKTEAPTKAKATGRLRRRSLDQINAAVSDVVTLLKKHPEGLRAEQIKAELKLDVREIPRVLKEGLTTKALKSKGEKRATTYTVRAGK